MHRQVRRGPFAQRRSDAAWTRFSKEREVFVLHHAQITSLEGAALRGMFVPPLMIPLVAILFSISPLSGDQKHGLLLFAVCAALLVILPTNNAARARARRVHERYLRTCNELFGGPPQIELESWLIGRGRSEARTAAT